MFVKNHTSISVPTFCMKKSPLPKLGSRPYRIQADTCFNHAVSATFTKLDAASSMSVYPVCIASHSLSITIAPEHLLRSPPLPCPMNSTISKHHSMLRVHPENSCTITVSGTMLYAPTLPASFCNIPSSTSNTFCWNLARYLELMAVATA